MGIFVALEIYQEISVKKTYDKPTLVQRAKLPAITAVVLLRTYLVAVGSALIFRHSCLDCADFCWVAPRKAATLTSSRVASPHLYKRPNGYFRGYRTYQETSVKKTYDKPTLVRRVKLPASLQWLPPRTSCCCRRSDLCRIRARVFNCRMRRFAFDCCPCDTLAAKALCRRGSAAPMGRSRNLPLSHSTMPWLTSAKVPCSQ